MLSPDATADGAIDVAATLRHLGSRWKLIAAIVIGAVAVAVVYLQLTTYRYAVQMRVAPVASSTGDGLSTKLSSLGGLAAVAGVSLPDSGGSGSFKLYIESLHSRDVAEVLARDPVIMHGVFAREWDGRRKLWRRPEGFVFDAVTTAKSALGIPVQPWAPPGAARLQAWMAQQIVVDQNVKTPVVTISLSSEDPAFATFFLSRLGTTIDGLLRQRMLLRTDDYIRYLAARLPGVQLAEQRVAVAQALGEQERLKMVASSDRAYAAEVFEHPAASERPVTPLPAKVLGIAVLLGLAAGVAIAFILPGRRTVPTQS